jgi:hypothetical protein
MLAFDDLSGSDIIKIVRALDERFVTRKLGAR